jgi:GT2 family glycosyltransferase
MKVSVCIPTYNSAAYIGECVASVLSQNSIDFEVIIFDNASDDGTWEIVQSLSDPRIKAFRSDKNRGMAVNFNRALDESEGEYIKLLCSDDRLEPSALELQTRFMDENREVSLVTSATRLIDRSGHPFATVQRFSEPIVIDANRLRASSLIYGNIVGEPSAVLFRRESWLRAGPFQEGLVTLIDLDMWFRLSRHGGIGYMPTPLCQVRRHPDSMTSQFRGAGKVQEAVLRMTEALLGELHARSFVRRVCLGKVAGSHLRHAVYGISRGQLKWPASAFATAFQIDPFFTGLFLYLALFRTELMGLKIGPDGHLSIGTVGTLNWVSTAT